jgi:hypothetical protein
MKELIERLFGGRNTTKPETIEVDVEIYNDLKFKAGRYDQMRNIIMDEMHKHAPQQAVLDYYKADVDVPWMIPLWLFELYGCVSIPFMDVNWASKGYENALWRGKAISWEK